MTSPNIPGPEAGGQDGPQPWQAPEALQPQPATQPQPWQTGGEDSTQFSLSGQWQDPSFPAPGGYYPAPNDQERRPGAVTIACFMVWLGSFISLAFLAVATLFVVSISNMGNELGTVDASDFRWFEIPAIFVLIVVALSIATFRRHKVPMYVLVVIGVLFVVLAVAEFFSSIGSLGLPLGGFAPILGAVWVAVVCGLLIKSRTWFNRSKNTAAVRS